MTTSETKQNPITTLAAACTAFKNAVLTYDLSMVDGGNVQGAISGVIGHAENVRHAADTLCAEFERNDNPTTDDVFQAANNAAFIRTKDGEPWLRIDAVDGGVDGDVVYPLTILAHDENTEAGGAQRLLIDEIDPKAVSFQRLVEFKL
jgi:hypothetical protein